EGNGQSENATSDSISKPDILALVKIGHFCFGLTSAVHFVDKPCFFLYLENEFFLLSPCYAGTLGSVCNCSRTFWTIFYKRRGSSGYDTGHTGMNGVNA